MVEVIAKAIRIGKFMKKRKSLPPHSRAVFSEKRMSSPLTVSSCDEV
jgi:hypothetical protein